MKKKCFFTACTLIFCTGIVAYCGDVESRIYKITSNIRYYQPNESKVKRTKRKKDGSITKGPNISDRVIEVTLSGPGIRDGKNAAKKKKGKGKKAVLPPVHGGLYVVYKKPFEHVYWFKKFPLNPGRFETGKWKKEFRVPGVVKGDLKYYHYYAAVFREEKGVKYHGSKPGMEEYITKLEDLGEGTLFDKNVEAIVTGGGEEKADDSGKTSKIKKNGKK